MRQRSLKGLDKKRDKEAKEEMNEKYSKNNTQLHLCKAYQQLSGLQYHMKYASISLIRLFSSSYIFNRATCKNSQ